MVLLLICVVELTSTATSIATNIMYYFTYYETTPTAHSIITFSEDLINCTTILQVYPTRAGLCAARVALFSWRFIIPLVVFIVCYWKIILAVKRSTKVGASHSEQPTAGQSTSAAAATGQSKPLNKMQKNVIKTMIVIISCFIVCWMPIQFVIVAYMCGVQSLSSTTLHYALAVSVLVSPCANPFIYATGLYPFIREKFVAGLRRLVRKENPVVHVEEQHCGTTTESNIQNARSRV